MMDAVNGDGEVRKAIKDVIEGLSQLSSTQSFTSASLDGKEDSGEESEDSVSSEGVPCIYYPEDVMIADNTT